MAEKSLDNLMMSFADLSSSNKGSSFKGPALKDVKVQKSSGIANFQPSQKARDWSSLEQSLESVFSVQSKTSPKAQPENEEDEFADFVGPSAIGSRLATFQEESPVHKFKAKIEVAKVLDDDDDFGDFAAPIPQDLPKSDFLTLTPNFSAPIPDFQAQKPQIQAPNAGFHATKIDFPPSKSQIQTSNANFQASKIDFPTSISQIQAPNADFQPTKTDFPSSKSQIQAPILNDFAGFPSPIQTKDDKFNQDIIFDSKPQVTLETFASFKKPSEDTIMQPIANNSAQDKYSALRDLLDINLDPSAKTETKVEDDDFGDFAQPQSLLPDESLVNSNPIQKSNSSVLKSVQIPTSTTNSSMIPWLENSPPPPPDDIPENDITDDNEFLGFDSAQIEQNSGFLKTDPVQEVVQDTLNPVQADFSSLNLKSEPFQDDFSSLNMKNEPMQDQNTDISSLNLRSISPKETEVKVNEEVVLRITNAVHEILIKSLEILSNADSEVKRELLDDPEMEKFVWNLTQVFRVHRRLKSAYSKNQNNPEIEKSLEEVEKIWRAFLKLLVSKSKLIPNNAVWDFSDCCLSASNSCGICRLNLGSSSKEVHSNIVETVIDHQGSSYHSICVNFWINCVDEVLPK